jgi:hypothetical protein
MSLGKGVPSVLTLILGYLLLLARCGSSSVLMTLLTSSLYLPETCETE